MSTMRQISTNDCLMDIDEAAWLQIVESRGGCCCHLSPPCRACSQGPTEDELNDVGFTYGQEGGAA